MITPQKVTEARDDVVNLMCENLLLTWEQQAIASGQEINQGCCESALDQYKPAVYRAIVDDLNIIGSVFAETNLSFLPDEVVMLYLGFQKTALAVSVEGMRSDGFKDMLQQACENPTGENVARLKEQAHRLKMDMLGARHDDYIGVSGAYGITADKAEKAWSIFYTGEKNAP